MRRDVALLCALLVSVGCHEVFGTRDLDASIVDATPDGPPVCVGTRFVVCASPPGPLTFTADEWIDTTDDPRCRRLDQRNVCYLAASTFTIEATASVRVVGARALVVVGFDAVVIKGTLDASSRVTTPVLELGPGAALGPCDPSSIPTTGGDMAGAGAAGGSFATRGGRGEAGRDVGGNSAGVVSLPGLEIPLPTLDELRGGCTGGRGAGVEGGFAGPGGGAVAVVTPTLSVSGRIDASGSPGGGGPIPRAGGGGGGSGGLIVIDAMTVSVTGGIMAHGGGGGEGGSAVVAGIDGSSSPGPQSVPMGGGGGLGGDGGNGAFALVAPMNGRMPNPGQSGGGGGGGGGAGWIALTPYRALGPQVSPPPTALPP